MPEIAKTNHINCHYDETRDRKLYNAECRYDKINKGAPTPEFESGIARARDGCFVLT